MIELNNNILQDIVHNYNNTYHNIIKITLSETQKKEKCKCIYLISNFSKKPNIKHINSNVLLN